MSNRLGYYRTAKAWYGDANKSEAYSEEFMIGEYYEEGGTSGEFAIIFRYIGSESAPCIEAFGDSWGVLWKCKDLLQALSAHKNGLTPEGLQDLLNKMGFTDLTPYKEASYEPDR